MQNGIRKWLRLVETDDQRVPPSPLYHGTLKSLISIIQVHGLQPQQGKLWSGVPLVFAADRHQRRKLNAVMLQQIGYSLGKPMHAVTGAEVLEHGAIAIITNTTPFQRARGYGKPIPHLERGDYYADQPVSVRSFMIDEDMAKFLGVQFRIWAKLQSGAD